MRFTKGTFLLEFFGAIPWVVIAAILVASSARHILPNSDTPVIQAPDQGARAVTLNREPAKKGAQPAFASARAARVERNLLHAKKKTAPPTGRKVHLNRPSFTVVGTLQNLAHNQQEPEKSN